MSCLLMKFGYLTRIGFQMFKTSNGIDTYNSKENKHAKIDDAENKAYGFTHANSSG